jgi:hypothetical protein
VTHPLTLGTTIAGRFRLLAQVGQGGMGHVFRAEDLSSGKIVALKAMGASEPALVERFVREARTLASLSHPAIVGYVAHGATHTGEPYLAMEWLEGEDLGRVLRSGPLSVGATLALLGRVAAGLAEAHRNGIVHRDLKPGNIVLVGRAPERATIVDFGIARPQGLHDLTRTGAIVGTAGYMAPEQIHGQRDLDGRADLFALGCVAYECLTGRAAFGSDAFVAVLARILTGAAPRAGELVPSVPAALDALVLRMLERDRDARPASANEVVRALSAITAGPESVSPAVAPTAAASRPALVAERIPIAIVLAWPEAASSETGATILAGDAASAAQISAEIAERWGGESVPVGAGLVLLSFARGAAVEERTKRAARAALALKDALPGCGISLALSMHESRGSRGALERAGLDASHGGDLGRAGRSRGGRVSRRSLCALAVQRRAAAGFVRGRARRAAQGAREERAVRRSRQGAPPRRSHLRRVRRRERRPRGLPSRATRDRKVARAP